MNDPLVLAYLAVIMCVLMGVLMGVGHIVSEQAYWAMFG